MPERAFVRIHEKIYTNKFVTCMKNTAEMPSREQPDRQCHQSALLMRAESLKATPQCH